MTVLDSKEANLNKKIVKIEGAEAERACPTMDQASKTVSSTVSFMQLDSFDEADVLISSEWTKLLQSHRRHKISFQRLSIIPCD